MKKILILLAWPVLAAGPTITPANPPVVTQGSTFQFTATGSGTITWSMVAGSQGSVNSSGLYTAPASVPVKQSSGGCAMGAPNHILNTDISSMPVDSTLTTFINTNASTHISYDRYGSFSATYIPASTPSYPMVFLYTHSNDGTYQVPGRAEGIEQENGYDAWPFIGDRHVMAIRPDNCVATEFYNLYKAGEVAQAGANCPTCTSSAGVQYATASSMVLTTGATDAAYLPLQLGMLRTDELRRALATGGAVTHAIRTAVSNSINKNNTFVWPAAAGANSSGQLPYGSRIRLKSSYSFTSPTSNPYVPILLTQLKNYGLFTADGGPMWEVYVEGKEQMDPLITTALTELNGASGLTANFEVVDVSGLNGNDGSALVAAGNAAAPVFAAVVATDSNGSTTRQIALRGLAIDVAEYRVYVQAGAPARQLIAYTSGGPDTTVTWTRSPATGSITSGGLYTPPATASSPALVTATVTSNADATVVKTVQIFVLPSASTIRLRANSITADYQDTVGSNWWYAMAGSTPMQIMQRIAHLNGTPVFGSPPDPALYSPDLQSTDMVWMGSIVPGNYKVTMKLHVAEASTGKVAFNFEINRNIVQHQLDVGAVAGGTGYTKDIDLPLVVGSDGLVELRIRRVAHDPGWSTYISSLQIAPDASAASVKIERGVYFNQTTSVKANDPYDFAGDISQGKTRQFFAQGWYQANTVTWSVLSGPGTIDSNGLYTAPSTPPPSPVPVTVKALSTVNGTSDTITFNFGFGTVVIVPSSATWNRYNSHQLTTTVNSVPYTNLTWTVESGPGSVSQTGLYTPPATLGADTTVVIRARSKDDTSKYADANITLKKAAIPINLAGNGAFTDSGGIVWENIQTDPHGYWSAITGTMHLWATGWACNNCVALGIDPRVVQGRRFGHQNESFQLIAPIPNGVYTVTLYWLEGDVTESNIQDVWIQGTKVLTAYNSVTDAGGYNLAVTKTFTATVTNGLMTIQFYGAGGSGTWVAISGIRIVETTNGAAPTCNPGANTNVTSGAGTSLDGSGSYSTNQELLSYTWQQVSGPNQAFITSRRDTNPAISGLIGGTYVFSLGVSDLTGGITAPCNVTITSTPTGSATSSSYPVGFKLSSVPNATKVAVTLVGPGGATATSTCTSSPCSVTINDNPGTVLVRLVYMDGSDKVLAQSSRMSIVGGN